MLNKAYTLSDAMHVEHHVRLDILITVDDVRGIIRRSTEEQLVKHAKRNGITTNCRIILKKIDKINNNFFLYICTYKIDKWILEF